jgi:hypothetical protein
MAEALDIRLRRFISENIPSVEQLEIVLLMAANAVKAWTADEVFAVIQSNRASIEARLKHLAARGFFELDESGGYRYKPREQELAECVAALQNAYKESRVKVIEAIYAPVDPAQTFADSFKIKRDK